MKMKKIIATTILGAFAFLIMLGNVQAQKKYINKASLWANDGVKLDTALNAVIFCETQEKTKDWFKTYYVKGLVFEAIAKTENEEFKSLSDKPLIYAFDNFKKSYYMDGSKAMHTTLDLKFVSIANDIINVGVVAYEAKDFVKAFEYFEKSLEVKTMPIFNNEIDTAIIYNIAFIAQKNDDWDNAIKYYNRSIELNYGEGDTYALLAEAYKAKGENDTYVTTLKTGFEKYPKNASLLGNIINYYLLESENTEEAFKYLEVAKESDPENPQFYFAEAHLYDKTGDKENAKAKYKKAIELDENFFDAYYNLGVIYFNKGVELTDIANEIKDNKKYEEAKKVADAKFTESLPYLEKAYELNPEETSLVATLKTLYYRLQMNDKYEEISKQ